MPLVVHSAGWVWNPARFCTKNIVDPYISIRSPGWRTPALNASAQASTVPAVTGVPVNNPVVSAAAAVTVPTTSPGHASRSSATSPVSSLAQFWCHSRDRGSYKGSH
jgi:hypothetical protein